MTRPQVRTDSDAVLVLGGRSEIGLAIARRLVAAGSTRVVLAARRADDLDEEVRNLQGAGAEAVHCIEFDADDLAGHAEVLAQIERRYGLPATTLVAFGVLGDQVAAEQDPAAAVAVVHTDYVAQVHLLTLLAQRYREAGRGRIVVFSSVAGVRVRRANYVYGSAKAGLDGFASGLSDALTGSGVRLLLVRPGFVVGRMTRGMSPAPLSSTPDTVADAVAGALARDREVVWVPGRLRLLSALMQVTPRALWRRLPR
ncbi:SDR family NAD(P)-dependent oxidoreductase [Trujillonella endophytica]|uniref:SDR family NAD(P)-dependent oxidoreductase n=1 Tax=Trujillonella endophytica TaxID=673521 RepID=UPI001FCDC097|nr:SDR family NAD(P)-dependent oxidoreductase [Trujillella endophytica]